MGINIGGGASGAAKGAAIGSIIPGIGTGIGAIAGGLFGLFGGGKKKQQAAAAPGIDWQQRAADYNTQHPLYQPGAMPSQDVHQLTPDASWGNYSSPNYGQIGQYAGSAIKSDPQVLKNLQAVTEMSNQLGGGPQAYQQALNTYSRLSSGDRGLTNTFLAPERAGIEEATKGAMSQLDRQAGVPAAARGAMQAETLRQGAGQLGLLAPSMMKDATAQQGQLGLQGSQMQGQLALGAGEAMGNYQNQIAGMNLSRMQNAQQMELANRQLGAQQEQARNQLGFSYANANLNAAMEHDQQALSSYFQNAGLQMELGNQDWQRNFYIPYSMDMDQQNRNMQMQQNKNQMWGGIAGGALSAIGQVAGAYLNRGK